MGKKIDFYNDSILDVNAGDHIPVIVNFMVSHIDHEKQVVYVNGFRCPYPDAQTSNGIPQGLDIGREGSIVVFKALFPALAYYEVKVF